jgi:Mg-chelatase subunit ChlD
MSARLPACAGIARAFALGMRDCGDVHTIAFGTSARVVRDFERVSTMGGTATHLALELAHKWIANRPGSKWIVLITDGLPGDRPATDRACAAALAAGCRVLAIGLGCTFTMPGAICSTANDATRLAIELDAATRVIEG